MNMAVYDLWTVEAHATVGGEDIGSFLIFAGDNRLGYQASMKAFNECIDGANAYANSLKKILSKAQGGKKVDFFYFHCNSGSTAVGGKVAVK